MYRGELLNSITHVVGTVLAVVGTTILVTIAALQHDVWKIVSFSIFGAMLILLYLSSVLYHSLRGTAKKVFHVFDHCAIYLLIAGTYTPITLLVLRGTWGWTIFAIVWVLAIAGVVKDAVFRNRLRPVSVVLYVIMGWLIAAAFGPLARVFPPAGIAWLVAGGVAYTIGIVFYALSKRVPHSHGVWHLLVMAGSVCHFVALLLYVALSNGGPVA